MVLIFKWKLAMAIDNGVRSGFRENVGAGYRGVRGGFHNGYRIAISTMVSVNQGNSFCANIPQEQYSATDSGQHAVSIPKFTVESQDWSESRLK